ncbi:hypothetical protein [Streptomyces humi]|nr:hypothetical protein [Streptomyces humi]
MRGGPRGRLTAYAGTARRRLGESGLGPVPDIQSIASGMALLGGSPPSSS